MDFDGRLKGIMATLPLGSVAGGNFVLLPSNWTPTPSTIMTDVSAGHPYAVKWVNNQFIIPVNVDQSSSTVKRLWASADPRQSGWTGYTLPYPDMTRPFDIDYFNGLYIVVGENSSGTAKCFTASSLDGTWTERTLPNVSKIVGLLVMDSKIIIVGKTSTNLSYWYSSNGTSYTHVNIGGTTYYPNIVAFGPRSSVDLMFASNADGNPYWRRFRVDTHADQGGGSITTYGGGTGSGSPVAAWGDVGNGRFQYLTSANNMYSLNPTAFSNSDWLQNVGITSLVSAGNTLIPHPSHNIGMFRNGRNVVFADSATLKQNGTPSWNGGFPLGNFGTASQTTTTATLDSATKWGGTYASTLGTNGTWLAIGFSDNTMNTSKKYDKIVYTDNPIW